MVSESLGYVTANPSLALDKVLSTDQLNFGQWHVYLGASRNWPCLTFGAASYVFSEKKRLQPHPPTPTPTASTLPWTPNTKTWFRDLWITLRQKIDMQSALTDQKANCNLGCTKSSVASRAREDDNIKALFFKELRDSAKSTVLVLIGDFNLSEINWEHHAAGTTWARRFLKNLDDNIMEQVLREPTWKDALLDLMLVNRVDLMSEVEIGGHLGHREHKVIEFKISVQRRKRVSKTSALDMRKPDFRLLRN
ncbi:hypothetical protein BTVI_58103 [Pitangus sulphuratus]|nr:hypothetical protein BTVI_58103 [Pitangus sulphuratus]